MHNNNHIAEAASFLPLSPITFYTLLTLIESNRHAYGLLKEMRRRIPGKAVVGSSTVYRYLETMLKDGLIEQLQEKPDPVRDDSRRIYYRISEMGRLTAMLEAERYANIVAEAYKKDLLKHTGVAALKISLRSNGTDAIDPGTNEVSEIADKPDLIFDEAQAEPASLNTKKLGSSHYQKPTHSGSSQLRPHRKSKIRCIITKSKGEHR